MEKKTNVENIGEAMSVLIQVAELAQKSGILSFDDAVVTKSAIDFLVELNAQAQSQLTSEMSSEEGPN
jgi:hypothetical protein